MIKLIGLTLTAFGIMFWLKSCMAIGCGLCILGIYLTGKAEK